MQTHFCNYSDMNYRSNQEKICTLVQRDSFFDTVNPYTREWLEKELFYEQNRHILDMQRLAGYALWKPYIILDLMSKIPNGDVVVYLDCGDLPISADINKHIKDYMNLYDQYLITTMVHLNHTFTKKDCFILMDCDSPKYWNAVQLEDGFLAFKKTKQNEDILREWLHFCKDERIITDIPNTQLQPNSEYFIDHRHDQSVLSLLQVKYDLPVTNEVRQYIHFNNLYHKNGESYSNGSANWIDGSIIN